MITREQILKLMPAPDNKNRIDHLAIVNENIIKTIHRNMPRAVEITKPVAHYFEGENVQQTCENIWNFLRTQIKYVKDQENQDIKLPNRFLHEGTGDCKSYSLFAGAVLKNLGIPSAFRYTSYTVDPTPQHVYVVALTGEKSIRGLSRVVITDGVWHRFNSQKPFTFKKDYMPIRTLSGTEDPQIGNVFKKTAQKVKKAASKVQDKLKDTKVVKKAAEIQDKAKDTKVVKKAAEAQSAVKQAGQYVAKKGDELLKKLPASAKLIIGAPARRAFRTLVAVNFRDYANKLGSNPNTRRKWEQLGGSWRELEASIRAGRKRKPLIGSTCMNCVIHEKGRIGEPVTATTVAAILAAATPVILALAELLKAGKKSQPVPESPATGTPTYTPPSPGAPGYEPPSGGQDQSQPGGYTTDNVNLESPSQGSNLPDSPADGSGYRDPSMPPAPEGYNYPYGGYDGGYGYGTESPGSQAEAAEEKTDNTALLVGGAILAKLLLF